MSKGALLKGNTDPVGEVVREVVGPPIATNADGAYVNPQTFALFYKWLSSSGAVFRMENPHDVDMSIVDIFCNVKTAPSAFSSSGFILWTLVASSSAVAGNSLTNVGRFSSSIGVVHHYPTGSSGFVGNLDPDLSLLWKKFGFSSQAWLVGQVSGKGTFLASSAAAHAYVTAIPLYSS